MVNLKNLLKTEHFSNMSSISIAHSGNTRHVWARLIIDAVDRRDLISEVKLDPLDPLNKVLVTLTAPQTGYIQVLDSSVINPPKIEEYGSYFRFASSEHVSSQTGETYIEKVLLDTGVLPVGTYLFSWSYFWNHSSSSSSFKAKITIDGEEVMAHEEQPASTTGDYQNTGSGQMIPAYGVFKKSFIGETQHSVSLSFCSSKAGRMSSIWNASLLLRKVPD